MYLLIGKGKMVKFWKLKFFPQNFPVVNQRVSDTKFRGPTKMWTSSPNSTYTTQLVR